MNLDETIRQIATSQHGLISRRQLRDVGASVNAVHQRLNAGLLERLSPCVYAIGGCPDTPARGALAAVLDVGEEAVLSHSSVAAWWQVPGFALSPAHTTRLRGGRVRPSHLSVVHQPVALTAEQVTVLHGVPVTTPARTIFDLAGCEPLSRTARALDYMLSRRLTTSSELHHLLRVLARRGRPGITVMRHLLAERPPQEKPAESNLERRFAQLASSVGFRDLERQVDIVDETGWIACVDFFSPSRRIVIEIDSVLHHSTLTDRRRDDVRTARLVAAGYTVLRFTEVEVFFESDMVMATLRALVLAA
jgi:very-short-patch-repair endonuclease